ncbi:hypothetical protein [Kribbella sindirgiensis]|uniref:hypothetical protein n=1 Tax=Kribbella sindirgiensis TaxID=1124744 RepID=UPI001EE0BE78|nr:hypothetical protein [Kribbella sindirgiensis]
MITIRLTAGDIGRIRFALSPVWEAVTSVRALSNNTARSVHGPWLQKVRPTIEGDDLTLLRALIPPDGYIPDFLTRPRRAGRRVWSRASPRSPRHRTIWSPPSSGSCTPRTRCCPR